MTLFFICNDFCIKIVYIRYRIIFAINCLGYFEVKKMDKIAIKEILKDSKSKLKNFKDFSKDKMVSTIKEKTNIVKCSVNDVKDIDVDTKMLNDVVKNIS